MNQRSTQFRSREERQRDERLQEKHSKIAMPAVCAAHALNKRKAASEPKQKNAEVAVRKRLV